MHVVVRFPVQQADDVVTIRKPGKMMKLMLKDAALKIPTDSDIQGAGDTSQNVDAVVSGLARHVAIFIRLGAC